MGIKVIDITNKQTTDHRYERIIKDLWDTMIILLKWQVLCKYHDWCCEYHCESKRNFIKSGLLGF